MGKPRRRERTNQIAEIFQRGALMRGKDRVSYACRFYRGLYIVRA